MGPLAAVGISDMSSSELRSVWVPPGGTAHSGFANRVQGAVAEVIAARLAVNAPAHVLDTAWRAYWRIVNEKNPDAIVLAEIVALQFREVLSAPNTTLKEASMYYTMLHDLYRLGASRNSDVKRFDLNAVVPFGRWLSARVNPVRLSVPSQPKKQLKVGYLCSWAMFTDGNPVADIVHEAINEHATRDNRTVHTYLTIAGNDEYVGSLNGTIVRDIRQGYDFSRLTEAAEIIRRDDLDVIIADGVGATATYLFQARVAPVQIYYDFGCPFWSISELDWAVSTHDGVMSDVGLPVGRTSKAWAVMLTKRRLQSVKRPVDGTLRTKFPSSCVIVGTVVRLSKVSTEYVRVLRGILERNLNAYCVVAGPEESYALEELASHPQFIGRISIVRGFQDMAEFGRLLDVFIDTFPFSGGAAPIEAAACGVPIVSMGTVDQMRDFFEERDPRLVARTEDEYVELVTRLIQGGEFYMSASLEAIALSNRYTNRERMVDRTEEAIDMALNYVRSRAAV